MSGRRPVVGSIARNAGLRGRLIAPEPVPRAAWREGDLVVAEVSAAPGGSALIETTTGRMAEVAAGDLVVGALASRAATLEAVGTWEEVGEDGRMQALTRAGALGRATSVAPAVRPLVPDLDYRGHVAPWGPGRGVADVVGPPPHAALRAPAILIVGTSMEAGKTTTARVLVRLLAARGLAVAGMKLAGAARFRDILAMSDAGADPVMDFVDAGLTSTLGRRDVVEEALRGLVARVAAHRPDVVVAEAGASPLEPYNGGAAVRALGARVRLTVLCASDPYAVVGVMQGFGLRPDLVAGRATSTTAGVALVERLCAVEALDILDPRSLPRLDALLGSALGLPPPGVPPAAGARQMCSGGAANLQRGSVPPGARIR